MDKKSITPRKRKRYVEKNNHVFFANVQKKRLELGMDQSSFGEQIGITRGNVSRLESGVFPCDPNRLVKIAEILGVSLDWLFGREK